MECKFLNIENLISSPPLVDSYHSDQAFLQEHIFPLIEDSVMIHDEFFEGNPFPTLRKKNEFIGQVFDENDQTVEEHLQILEDYHQKYI